MRYLLSVAVLVLTAGVLNAATIHVPADQPTIQAGIDAAVDGDTVLVAAGTYTGDGNRDMDYVGKAIVVMAEAGPQWTTIDCQGSESDPHRAFIFQSEEDTSTVLNGFTIVGGYGPYDWPGGYSAGGGIYLVNSSPHLTDLTFRQNVAAKFGGAIACNGSSPHMELCAFDSNMTYYGGGGLFCNLGSSPRVDMCTFAGNHGTGASDTYGGAAYFWNTSPIITNSLFSANSVTGQADLGGAVYCERASPVFINCTFVANASSHGAAIHSGTWSSPIVVNSIIAFSTGAAVFCSYQGVLTFFCSDIFGNSDGDWTDCIANQADEASNLSIDPAFCDTAALDFSLYTHSRCLPSNNDCGRLIGARPMGCTCCTVRGDLDHSISPIDIADLVFLVDYMFNDGDEPPCPEEADIDSSGGTPLTDISDLVFLVDYMFTGGPAPAACP